MDNCGGPCKIRSGPPGILMHIDSKLLYDNIRQRIKAIRTAEIDTRLSQEELGKILGLTRSTVANIESGTQRASLHNIYEICAQYNLELSDLLPGVADMQKRSAGLKYEGIDPGLSPILEKLQRKG